MFFAYLADVRIGILFFGPIALFRSHTAEAWTKIEIDSETGQDNIAEKNDFGIIDKNCAHHILKI